jgi:hypothetical protein
MKTVTMQVTVTVEQPQGQELSDERATELAMSAVAQFHEVEFGRDSGPGYNRISWAKIYAEVSEEDCEVHD